MTEQIIDDRESQYTAVPYYKVVRLQADPDGKRVYCVMQKMTKDDEYAGWKHDTKTYEHSTSAYARMGRLVQRFIHDLHFYLPENER